MMVDIYRRSLPRVMKPGDVDLSKCVTQDELADLMRLAGVDQDEVVVFQDQNGWLKTSSIKLVDNIMQVSGMTSDNIVVFTDGGRIEDLSVSIEATIGEIFKRVAKTADRKDCST